MRTTLLVSALLGGAVSLLAVVATHAHTPGAAPRLAATEDPPPVDPPAGAELATRDDPPAAPSWVAERVIDGPPVSLTASDGSGLAIASLRASAVVEGPLAFTEVKLAFDNPENRVREGTFKIVLPQGASLGRFAMKINDAWQEGEVVPKERARVAYEDALHRKQDPALLERGAGNEFTARVFPIPARGRKEIIVSYAQELVGGAQYALPLRGLPQLGVLDVSVGGEGVTPQHLHQERAAPTADFVMEAEKRPGPSALRAGNLVVARVRPVREALPEPITGAVVLVDTSASRALGLAAELRSVQALLEGLAARHEGEIPVTVAAFDQEVVPFYRGDARGFGQAENDRINARRALGASNLARALGWAQEEAKRTGAKRVILVTDGVPTAGEDDGAKLAKAASALKDGGAERLDVVAVGGLRDDALARKLVTAGLAHDGVVVPATDGAVAVARRLEAGTRSDLAVTVEGASWSYPTRLDGVQSGDEVLVYAELGPAASAATGKMPLRVKLGSEDVRSLDAIPAERPLLERAWAQAKIANLEAEERDKGKSVELEKKIVELSTSHRVLSAYTSLLVLETDADYARFHIDRRALADVLTVSDGQLAWAKRGELATGPARAKADEETATAFGGRDKAVASAGGDLKPAEEAVAHGRLSPAPALDALGRDGDAGEGGGRVDGEPLEERGSSRRGPRARSIRRRVGDRSPRRRGACDAPASCPRHGHGAGPTCRYRAPGTDRSGRRPRRRHRRGWWRGRHRHQHGSRWLGARAGAIAREPLRSGPGAERPGGRPGGRPVHRHVQGREGPPRARRPQRRVRDRLVVASLGAGGRPRARLSRRGLRGDGRFEHRRARLRLDHRPLPLARRSPPLRR